MSTLHWQYQSFEELTNTELYTILQVRIEVFSVEQNCVYQDADNKDLKSFHLSAWDNNVLVAYCRILPPGVSYKDASIGRVLTALPYRKTGAGRELMQRATTAALQQFNCSKITISAQLYLKRFYESLGFIPFGETYLEDSIPHIEMHYTA
jgi:ElaA protein